MIPATYIISTDDVKPLARPSDSLQRGSICQSDVVATETARMSCIESFDHHLMNWIKSRVKLRHYDPSMWLDKQNEAATMFLCSPWISTLFIAVDTTHYILHVSTECQSVVVPGVMEVAFILREKGACLTSSNVASTVQFGTFSVNQSAASVKFMLENVIRPYVLLSTDWTDSTRKELDSHYYRLMISLTESANQLSGRTDLYLPPMLCDVVAYTKDGDNVQHLESIAIHWASQIKGLINCQSDTMNAENSGLVAEINFWSRRSDHLMDLSSQLKCAPVQQILKALDKSNSSYVKPVRDLFQEIDRCAYEADDTIKYLCILTAPCNQISKLPTKDIPELFPVFLSGVQQISSDSRYYNTKDKVSRLLQKISLEIIAQCRLSIPLENVLTGVDVKTSLAFLDASIHCGEMWNQCYQKMADSINNAPQVNEANGGSGIKWDFDETSLFAQVDASIRRFQDLREICDGFIQFVSSDVMCTEHHALFRPSTAFIMQQSDLFNSLNGIEVEFRQFVAVLRSAKYDILDLRSFQWHEDMQKFKLHLKDLSSMYNIIIKETFDSIETISVAVEVLEAFKFVARREEICHCLEKQAHRMRILFIRQCERVRGEFDEHRRDFVGKIMFDPPHAGAARWAQFMSDYVLDSWNLLKGSKCIIVQENDEADFAKVSLVSALDLFKGQCFKAWTDKLQGDGVQDLQDRFHDTLLRKIAVEGSRKGLTCNFDDDILAIFDEAREWQKFPSEDYDIPNAVLALCHQHEHLRLMRERVMLVVQGYNEAHATPSDEDYGLLSVHLRQLERKILPGLSKLNWGTKAILIERFVEICTKEAYAVMKDMNDFRNEKSIVFSQCQRIYSLGLLKVEKTLLYNALSFGKKQSQHRTDTEQKFKHCHLVIKATMQTMFMKFQDQSEDIHHEWNTQINIVNKKLENCLLDNVKHSLKTLLHAMNGGSATGEPKVLFVLTAVLDKDNMVVQCRPTVIEVTHAINTVAKEMIGCIKAIPRLVEHDFKKKTGNEEALSKSETTFYESISNDEDVLQLVVKIMNETIRSATEVRSKLLFWDQFKNLWEVDKESFIRKCAKANQTLEAFDRDMAHHAKHQLVISSSPNVFSVQFIKVDNAVLKATLMGHNVEWLSKISGLLHKKGELEVQRLHDLMGRGVTRLKVTPTDVASLRDMVECKDQWKQEFNIFQESITLVESTYSLLSKHNVLILDHEHKLLLDIRPRWVAFQEDLNQADALIARGRKYLKHKKIA